MGTIAPMMRKSWLYKHPKMAIVNLIFPLMSFPHYSLFHRVKVVYMSEKVGRRPHFQAFFP
jgi:hypothetical protein